MKKCILFSTYRNFYFPLIHFPDSCRSVGLSIFWVSLFAYLLLLSLQFSKPYFSLFHRWLDTICTGQGSCLFKDPSGNSIQSCSAFNTTCTASCSCSADYGGMDCSLNALALTSRDSLRYLYDPYLFTRIQYGQTFFAPLPLLNNFRCLLFSLFDRYLLVLFYHVDLHYVRR